MPVGFVSSLRFWLGFQHDHGLDIAEDSEVAGRINIEVTPRAAATK